MPCYNAAPFIAEAIRSVLSQDYPGSLEVVVIDDGSTDDSVRIAQGFDQVRVLSQRNSGPAAARNLGLQHARGELIAFLDADDQWLPGSLSPRIDVLLEHKDVGAVYGSFLRWTPPANDPFGAGLQVADRLPDAVMAAVDSEWLYPAMLLDPIIHIITLVARREVFEKIGNFDPALRMGEDYDILIRMALQFRMRRVERRVARYRQRPDSITHVPRKENYEYLVVQRAIRLYGTVSRDGAELDRQLVAKRMYRLCFQHGYSHFWSGDAAVAAGSFQQALRHDPFRVKAWLYAALATPRAVLARSALAP